ncbi:hypothetical protein Haur_5262 (plasmid) [Herpetosiphon aurantiacus DSM 785]|uniref:Uncharacterized protein n=1 Tax=Herpetosiphon aurantiacus (strain ATCC 23779 / DSM 785 / 114-95) TaxID=316274 RepID=A9B975_HERA2|nr:hypothetical protein Haur_5262 [Herpetosiphon aurantiacus DSM 785]
MRHHESIECALDSANAETIELLFFVVYDHRNKLKEVEWCLQLLKVLVEADASFAPLMDTLGFGLRKTQGTIDEVQELLTSINGRIP